MTSIETSVIETNVKLETNAETSKLHAAIAHRRIDVLLGMWKVRGYSGSRFPGFQVKTVCIARGVSVDETGVRYEGWRVAAAAGVGVFFASMSVNVFAVFLKPLSEEFAWSRQTVSTAYGVMAMAAAVSAPVVGRLIDRLGARAIILPSATIAGCTIVSLSALTAHRWHVYLAFAILGVATIGASPLAQSRVVASWFDRQRGAALAVMLTGAGIGAMLQAPAAQTLIRSIGWRRTYVALGTAVLLIGLPVVVRFIHERSGTARPEFDPSPDPAAVASDVRADGVRVGVALRSYVFWILLIVVFGSAFSISGALVHLSALLTDRGLPASAAAVVLSAMGLASLAGRLGTGWLLDRFFAPRVSFVLLTLAAIGTFLLATAHSFTAGVIAAALIGLGTGGELDVTPYLLSRYFGLRSMSTLYGFAWTALGCSGIVGPILMGRAFDATGSYETILIQYAIATFLVATLMLVLPRYGQIDG
jgi:MFS family permease